jgi:hypothetical protein
VFECVLNISGNGWGLYYKQFEYIMTLSILTFSIMTFSIMTFSIMAFSIMTFIIMTFSIVTFSIMTLRIMTFRIMPEHCYAECLVCWLSLMLSVTHKPFMLSVIMPNVVVLNVVAPLEKLLPCPQILG